MLSETITSCQAQRFYDWLGAGHDLGERYERAAKARGLALLDCRPGQRVLNAGVGTGKEQIIIQERLLPTGIAVGIDISPTMLALTAGRVPPPANAALCRGEIQRLPYANGSFDRVFSSYVLDLIPLAEIHHILAEFYRVLRPGGRLVTVSLTAGITLPSRLLMGAWQAFYRVSPIMLGGCRPVRLTYPFLKAGFSAVNREVVVQLGMPSEIVTGVKQDEDTWLPTGNDQEAVTGSG
jgi:ubiquinone/menaquinone biosynthesis C-methylase UbiE